jgi:hypothetical protein
MEIGRNVPTGDIVAAGLAIGAASLWDDLVVGVAPPLPALERLAQGAGGETLWAR